jgi:diguanylate cyclase (GGDEF)-like protein
MNVGLAYTGRSRWLALVAGAVLAVAVGLADVATGYEINLGLFYLVPIAVVTWGTGLVAGLMLAVTSVVVMFIVENFVTRDIPFPSSALVPYWNAAIRLGYFCVFAFVLSALRRAHERERALARQDHVTGIANSQAFAEASRREIARAHKHRHPLSVVYIDCDNFKHVNDSMGHPEGDRLLRAVAQTMAGHFRSTDVVARLGGDEFAVLLPEAGEAVARRVVRDVSGALDSAMAQQGWPVTFSIGVVTFLTPPADADHAIHATDLAMYSVKTSGKNNVVHRVVGGGAS